MNIIAIDFDGTLHRSDSDLEIIDAVNSLYNLGYQIIIHTCRINPEWKELEKFFLVEEMLEWLKAYNVKFHKIWGIEINHETNEWKFNSDEVGKPIADVYIDDKAMNLRDFRNLIELMKNNKKKI